MCIFTTSKKIGDLISFGIKYWLVLLLAVIVAALGVSLFLYLNNKKNKALSGNQVRILGVLRFLSVFIIAFLLLAPFVKNMKKITRNPIVVVAWDNSASLQATPDSVEIAAQMQDSRAEISDRLSGKYQVVEYTFGEETSPGGDMDFSKKKSDYSEVIATVVNNHFNENIGALIVGGDGIYNQGKNPLNLLDEVNFPIYTLGFGDTTEIADARVLGVRANRTAFSGNRFPVEIEAQFSKLKGRTLKLSVLQNGNELASVAITPPNENYFVSRSFVLDAGAAGLKHFDVQVESAENEQNKKNNRAGFVINVLENKQKIAILSDGPHPDIGAIKNTLDLQQTYELSVFTEAPYPSNLADFNLLVLYQLPTTGQGGAEIIALAEKSRLPILFVVGNKTFLPQLNALAQGAAVKPLAGGTEQAQPMLNPAYATFSLSENFKETLPQFPPLQVPFAEYETDASFTPLFYQKIMNTETGKPLLATGTQNGRKIGFIFGEGIWRWRLYDFYLHQNQDRFNEFVNQLVQYLSLRENEDNFIVDFQPVYDEIDNVVFKAEVYNDVFEQITTEEVAIEITDSENSAYDFTFDVRNNSYFLDAGKLPIGDYDFTASVEIGNEKFSETGSFTVTPVNIESIVTRANHNVLFQLAEQSGGRFYVPGNTAQLVSELEQSKQLKPTTYLQEMVHELLNLKWIFFVVLLLLSVEWFLRKYWGIY